MMSFLNQKDLRKKFQEARLHMIACRQVAHELREKSQKTDTNSAGIDFKSNGRFDFTALTHNVTFCFKKHCHTGFKMIYGSSVLSQASDIDAWLIHLCKQKTNVTARKLIWQRKIFLEKVLRRLLGVKLIIDEIVALVLWEEFDYVSICSYDSKASFQLKEIIDQYHSTPHGKPIPIHFDMLDHVGTINKWLPGPTLQCIHSTGTKLQYKCPDTTKFFDAMQKYKKSCDPTSCYLYTKHWRSEPVIFKGNVTKLAEKLDCISPHALAIICRMQNCVHEEPSCPMFSRVTVYEVDEHDKIWKKLGSFAEEECRLFPTNYHCYVLPDIANSEIDSHWMVANTIDAPVDHSCTGVKGFQRLKFTLDTNNVDEHFQIDILAFGVRMLAPNMTTYAF